MRCARSTSQARRQGHRLVSIAIPLIKNGGSAGRPSSSRDRRTRRRPRAADLPSVEAISYLGILQPGHGNAAAVAERRTPAWPEFEVAVTMRFEQNCRVRSKTLARSGSRKPSGKPCGVSVTNW